MTSPTTSDDIHISRISSPPSQDCYPNEDNWFATWNGSSFGSSEGVSSDCQSRHSQKASAEAPLYSPKPGTSPPLTYVDIPLNVTLEEWQAPIAKRIVAQSAIIWASKSRCVDIKSFNT
eukprot:4583514-Pleurochrysis_carterae.AAC.4